MVLIREAESNEDTEGSGLGTSAGASPGASSHGRSEQHQQRMTLKAFITSNSIDALACTLRFITLFFALNYMLPISSPPSQYSSYSKAFMASAATNAFRLHHRLKGSTHPTFSRAFLNDLVMEDSAHYLLYSLLFTFSTPVTMALLPVLLYALLQNLNFCLKLAIDTGNGGNALVERLQRFKTDHTGNVLSTIACAEIIIFPVFTLLIFTGRVTILFPFIYYRFLTLRYVSRRNPYTRETFAQMKNSLYMIAGNPSCPQIARSVIFKLIYCVERLSPI